MSDLPSRVQKGDRIRVKLRDGMVVSGRFRSELFEFPPGRVS
jgi:hypothetical protein